MAKSKTHQKDAEPEAEEPAVAVAPTPEPEAAEAPALAATETPKEAGLLLVGTAEIQRIDVSTGTPMVLMLAAFAPGTPVRDLVKGGGKYALRVYALS